MSFYLPSLSEIVLCLECISVVRDILGREISCWKFPVPHEAQAALATVSQGQQMILMCERCQAHLLSESLHNAIMSIGICQGSSELWPHCEVCLTLHVLRFFSYLLLYTLGLGSPYTIGSLSCNCLFMSISSTKPRVFEIMNHVIDI